MRSWTRSRPKASRATRAIRMLELSPLVTAARASACSIPAATNRSLGFDTSTKIAHTLAHLNFEGLGIDYIGRRNALVSAVTEADIRRAAARTLGDGRLLFVIAGRPVF